jgi:hypothetical protein
MLALQARTSTTTLLLTASASAEPAELSRNYVDAQFLVDVGFRSRGPGYRIVGSGVGGPLVLVEHPQSQGDALADPQQILGGCRSTRRLGDSAAIQRGRTDSGQRHRVIGTTSRYQLTVAALLDDPAGPHHQNVVGVPDR